MNRCPPAGPLEDAARGGFALVAVLVIVCVLALLVGRLSVSTMTELELARSRARAVELRAALESGVALARCMLAVDRDEGPPGDSAEDAWARGPMQVRIGDVDVIMNIRDENSKVSVPHVLAATRPADAREFGRALRLFVRESARAFGAEEDEVRRWLVSRQHMLDLPERLAGGPLFDVEGAGSGAVLPVGRYLTVWTDGGLNVNTAPREAMEYLWGRGNERLVRAVIERREEKPFARPEEVFALPGAGQTLRRPGSMRVLTESRVFEIEIVAQSGPARLCERVIVTRREPDVPVLFRQLVPHVSFRGEPRRVGIAAFTGGEDEGA